MKITIYWQVVGFLLFPNLPITSNDGTTRFKNKIALLMHLYKLPFSGEYWEGGILPKIGQFGSTLISLYNPEVLNTVIFGVNMTHAHLRVDQVR
jgi:hypothetical protein